MEKEEDEMKRSTRPELLEIVDEPGMAERFQRGLQRALNTPPQHRPASSKDKTRPASKGRVHKGKK